MTKDRISVYYLAGPHPVNESFVRTPPENANLRSNINTGGFENFSRPKEFKGSWKKKKLLADSAFRKLGIPRTVPVFQRCDLIHTNGGIVPVSLVPWVASVENPSGFFGFDERWHHDERRKRRLAKHLLSSRCRRVLPYSNASADYILRSLNEWADTLSGRMTILYPAIDDYLVSPAMGIKAKAGRGGPTRFLFVGDHFFDKGGREVVRAFENVRDESPSRLTLVTSAPQHHRKEYESFRRKIHSIPDVDLIQTGIPRQELLELYRESDVFVFPSYMDQVPFVLLEAMAAGLAMIGSNSYAIPEMVQDGRNGFNVDSPCLAFPNATLRTERSLAEYRENVLNDSLFDDVVDNLVEIMTRYARSRQLVSTCGAESYKMVTEGRFSTRYRNSVLSQVYARSTVEDRLRY